MIVLITETGNLIDLNSDGTTSSSTNLNTMPEHNYVNDSVIAANRDNHRDPASLFDVFDMRKNLYYLVLLMKVHNLFI